MQKIKKYALVTFLFLGERIALFVILILAGFVISTQTFAQGSSSDQYSLNFFDPDGLVIENQQYFQTGGLSFESEPPENITQIFLPTPTPTTIPIPTPTSIPTPTPTTIPPAIPAPTEIPQPTAQPVPADPNDIAVWEALALCESKSNWSIDTGNGYYGGLQFSQSAWESVGGSGNPAHASREEQIERGKALAARRGGFGAWGLCAKKLGLN